MGAKERKQYKLEILNNFSNGENLSNIAKNLKLNRYDVKLVLVEHGLYSESKRYIKDDLSSQEKMVQLYRDHGKSLKEISNLIGYEVRTIKNVLVERGIELKNAGYYNRKYSCNDRAFDSMTAESVYWAGFIAGDGCVYSHGLSDKSINNCLNVTLASHDREHLDKLKRFLGYDGKLYVGNQKVALTVNNPTLVKQLEDNFNITNNKTLVYEPPNNIPNDLIKYFILGLFDSDGCITKTLRQPTKTRHYKGNYAYMVNFTGTMEVCKYILSFFNSSVKIHKRHKNETNNYTVHFQGNEQIIKYLGTMYDEVSVHFALSRKLRIYNELVNQ